MRKILERYIAKTIFMTTAMTTLILTSVMILLMLLGELKNMGEGDYGFIQAVIYVLLRLPNEVYQFSPMLILLGSITGLSILSSYRELAVMRASGFSIRQIIYSVLLGALLIVAAITFLGEWIGPNLSYKAEVHKENAQNAGQAVVTASGIWFHLENNFIHVRQVVGRQLLEGVTRYQFDDDHRLLAAYYAKTLSYQQNQWQMKDVVKTTFYNNRTQSQAIAQMPWNLKFNTNLLNVGLVDPSELSLPKLYKFSSYLEQNGLQASEYQYDFWRRVFQPLSSLVMIFLAIPFVLGTFSMSTLGFRLIMGILVGFAFFILNALVGQLCMVFQLPTFLAALIPPLIFVGLGLLLAHRMIKQ